MRKINLLAAEEILDCDNLDILEPMVETISDRLDWLCDREPEFEGEVYDTWEEKYSEWESILGEYTDCRDTIDSLDMDEEDAKEEIEEAIENVKGLLEDFQDTYGGISRLYILVD